MQDIHDKLKSNPIIQMMIDECEEKDQRLHFYFIGKNGKVKPYAWRYFFRKDIKDLVKDIC